MLNVDAPTRRQFDLPWQPKSRDTSKGLEGSKQEVGIQSNRACERADAPTADRPLLRHKKGQLLRT